MKRFLVLMMVVIVLILSSCSNYGKKGIQIGFLIHSSANARWQMDIGFLNERAKELGGEIVLRDAGGDENVQLKQAHELLELGVDVLIVVAASQNTAGGIVRDAHKYGVKVISYDRTIMNADLDYLISFEYEKVGELMVEYITDRVPGGNCIQLIGDPNDANAVFIKNGQDRALSVLNEDKKQNIVYKTYIDGWKGETAYVKVDKILDFSPEKIDAVIASNIPLAIGACNALSNHGYDLENVIVTAMDATTVMIHSMLNGGISMTVVKPIKKLAYGAIDLAIDIVSNSHETVFEKTVFNGRKEVPAKLFAPTVIDLSNYEKELFETGLFNRIEVFQ